MREVQIYGVSFDMVGKQPIVLLKTVDDNRFLPIWIGPPEAAAILMKLQGADTPRPMTHDLMKNVLDTLDGSPVMASAAYNAGPGRARAWRADQPMEAAIYAESIPFNETRDYVKRVMANSSYYAHNFSQQLQSLRARIGSIEPRSREREKPLGDTP